MTLKQIFGSKWISLLGIMGPVIAILSIAISISLSPWFSFEDNALSDLGVHPVGPIFNSGLIICGIFCAVFSVALYQRIERNWPYRIGIFLLFTACIALVGIGVFTEDSLTLHMFFSVAFFVILILAALTLGVRMLLDPEKRIPGLIALCVVVIGTAGWAFSDHWRGVAIPELLSAVPACIWLIFLAMWLYRRGSMTEY